MTHPTNTKARIFSAKSILAKYDKRLTLAERAANREPNNEYLMEEFMRAADAYDHQFNWVRTLQAAQ